MTDTMTTLERVARAIAEDDARRSIAGDDIEERVARLTEWHWRKHIHAARAALQALRQVDDETLAAIAEYAGGGFDEVRAGWTATINHILGGSDE